MTNQTLAPAFPAVPPEVLAFATEQGVRDFVPGVLEMTRAIFGSAPLRFTLTEDPEIEDYRHLAIEVEAGELNSAKRLELGQRWSHALFDVCPATHVLTFLLRLR